MVICPICGNEKSEDEVNDGGICYDCASTLLQQDGINMGLGDEFL